MPGPSARTATVLTGAVLLLVTGCSSDGGEDKIQTIDAATAAESPVPSNPPAGTVAPLDDRIAAATFDPSTGTVAMLTDDARTLLTVPAGDPAAPPREISLPGGVASLSAPRDGLVTVPAGRGVATVNLADGTATTTAVDADVQSAALLGDGRIAVGTADGDVLELDAAGTVTHTVDGLVSVDALGVVGDEVSALDRRQTSVTEVNFDDDRLGMALRAGSGATNLVTDDFGRILVADTTGGTLLSFSTDPLMLHQRYPVPNSPYALAVDATTGMVWVTVTATNEVVGYDLSTGIPVEKRRFPTVRQPNAVAVDSETGTVFVASGTGDGVQRIDVATS
ncbi:YncE family protein [Rhodococcus gannanensis]|uniref:YncE family protein n=1 Tax=Rhodococcus gannanensis TaxID=1960308 RepID=A0ABW4P7V2_9NOCA